MTPGWLPFQNYQDSGKFIPVVHKTKLITPPEAEPIDLIEAKLHLKVTGSIEDDLITSWITSTRRMVERYLNRALITQQHELYFDNWPCGEIRIPFGSLQSVDSIKYRDIDGNENTISEGSYFWVDDVSEPAQVIRKYTAVWPIVQYGRPNAVKVTFTCGYGDTGADVPMEMKDAMKLWLTDLYENRGTIAVGPAVLVNVIPNFVVNLIHTYKIYDF